MNTATLCPPEQQSVKSTSLENADALLIALRSQRYVVVRRDRPLRLVPAERICKPVRDLKPGDEVFYNGRRDEVLSLCVY